MWTICWTYHTTQIKCWECHDTVEEIVARITELFRQGVEENAILVFPPDTEMDAAELVQFHTRNEQG